MTTASRTKRASARSALARPLDAVTSAAFAGASATFGLWVLLARSEVAAGAFALALAAFFVLAAVESVLVGRAREGARLDVVAHNGAKRPALVFPYSRLKQWLAALQALALVASGALMLLAVTDVHVWIFAPLLLAVAARLAAVAVRDAVQPRRFVALPRDGILTRTGSGSVFLPWDAIQDASVERGPYGKERFAVRLRERDAGSAPRRSRLRSWLRGSRDGDVVLPDDLLVASKDDFRRTVERCLRYPEDRAALDAAASRTATETIDSASD